MLDARPFSGEIYVHMNLLNGKSYVGQTTAGMEKRWKSHLQCARSCKTPAYRTLLAKAIRKYGADAFESALLSVAGSQAHLDNLEKVWIILLQSKSPNGYNLSDGGYAAAGHVVTAEVRAVLSAAAKAQWQSPEFIQKVENGLYADNGNLSPEDEARRLVNLRAALCGKKQSEETIAKRIAKTTGLKRTAEFRTACAARMTGKKMSEETRLRMSAAQVARQERGRTYGA